MSRTKLASKNLVIAFSIQTISFFVVFTVRTFFIINLGKEYLGISGLFTSVLTVLSVAELGFSQSIMYSLYKPLRENDKERVNQIILYLGTVYKYIAILVLIIGLAIIPFLKFIVPIDSVGSIYIIFLLFLFNSVFSYLFAYKRVILYADQRKYIDTIIKFIFFLVMNFIQVLILVLLKNYILYLVVQVAFTLIENLIISRKVTSMYNLKKAKDIEPLSKLEKQVILKNTFALSMHKGSSAVVQGTDNIIISAFINVATVGLLANYTLITNYVNRFSVLFTDSITGSVGNLNAEINPKKSYDIFKKIFTINFVIYGYSSVILYFLTDRLIYLWIGSEYILDKFVFIIILINFYIMGMKHSIVLFKNTTGMFYKDRFWAIIRAFANVVLSLIFVKCFGLIGIFLGTTISLLGTYFITDPYFVYKYIFDIPRYKYYTRFIYSTLVPIASIISVELILPLIEISNLYLEFFAIFVLTSIVFTACLLFLNFRNKEFKSVFKIVLNSIQKIIRK